MKSPFILFSIAAVALSSLAFAAGDGKPRQNRPQAAGDLAEVLKPYDKNGNRQIDGDELAAVQNAFASLGKLDKNANGEIEQGEIQSAKSVAGRSRPEGLRTKAAAGFQKVDKNGNHRIDPDEVSVLEKMLGDGPGAMLKRLDQNGNGKLEETEIARLNERMEKGGGALRSGTGASTPSFHKPPEKPAEATKPAETIKPAEKAVKPEGETKPAEKKIEFGS